MSEVRASMAIVNALQQGNHAEFTRLLDGVNDVNAWDDSGWTLLHWASGRGDLDSVRLLIEKGADVFKRSRDERTPYLVALAAGRREVIAYLAAAEAQRGGDATLASSRQVERRRYCKAYPLDRLRAFPGWREPSNAAEQPVAFLHQDFSVTRAPMHGEDVMFASHSSQWRAFCQDELQFRVPSDMDLIAAE